MTYYLQNKLELNVFIIFPNLYIQYSHTGSTFLRQFHKFTEILTKNRFLGEYFYDFSVFPLTKLRKDMIKCCNFKKQKMIFVEILSKTNNYSVPTASRIRRFMIQPD